MEVGQRSGPNENRSEVGNVQLRIPCFDGNKNDVGAYLKRFREVSSATTLGQGNVGYPAGFSFWRERR